MDFSSLYTWSKSGILKAVFRRSSAKAKCAVWALVIFFNFFAAFVMVYENDLIPYNCFSIPIFLAALLLGRQGVWDLILNLILLAASLHMRGYDFMPLAARCVFELGKWSLVVLFTLVTAEYAVRIKEREDNLDRDMEMARTLQKALIPENCSIGKVDIFGIMNQCRSIGGDYYYFRPFMKKHIVFCLGDVMGKGVPASMIMSVIMSFFFEWGKKTTSPSEIISMLNARMLESFGQEFTWFTTLFYGVFDDERGILTYASGAHDTAVIVRADGRAEHLQSEGLPVGAFDDSTWEEKQIKLRAGDKVILFTDGVTEARSGDKFFGMERVLKYAETHASLSGEAFVKGLEGEIISFTGGHMTDDLAVLAMEIKHDVVFAD